jgi:Putative Actinobacterial Holin-X, holin superfamily III
MSDEPAHSDGDEDVSDLVEQLGRDTSRLVLHDAALAASERIPALRRVALGAAAAVVAVLAFAAAFGLANWAAVSGLSSVLPTWLAALLLAVAWLAVGVVLFSVLLVKLGHLSGIEWWRMVGADRDKAVAELQASREEAEQAMRESIERLAGAIAGAVAGQVSEAVDSLAEGAADITEDLLEASEDIVDTIEEEIPGGGAVAQVVDVVLYPGRLGLRVATSVLKAGGSNEATD